MSKLETRVYQPGSPLKNPIQFFAEIWAGFMASRELAWRLTLRDFSAKYRQSIGGYVWAFLPPIVASFTFILLRSGGAINVEEGEIPYAAFALTGTILWQVFVDSLNNPMRIMQSCRQMLIKVNFPREALIISPIQSSFITLGIRLFILIPAMLWFRFPLSFTLLLVPVGLLFLVLLGNCIGLLLAPIGALYKDIQQGLVMITTFWMFLTPVVFPNMREGLAGTLMRLNPVTYILGATRDWMTGVSDSTYTVGFIVVAVCTLCLLAIGAILFRVFLGRVIERMGM
jgi:lipopolysaccharide transport system permease protein